METLSPRIRSLVRQANKVAESGKRSAATKLYRQIIDEAPDTVEAWVGLSNVLRTQEEKEEALQRALELDPDSESAKYALAVLHGEIPEEPEEPEEAEEPEEDLAEDESSDYEAAAPARESEAPQESLLFDTTANERVEKAAPVVAASGAISEEKTAEIKHADHDDADGHELEYISDVLYCANHPNRETHLRCNKCAKPICTSCAQRTPVGYRCPECIREHEDIFFTAKPLDYLIAVLIALPLSLIAGIIATRIGFFVIFLAAAAGSLIGQLVFRAVGRRRGRWLPQLVGIIVVIGGILPATPYLLAIIFGSFSFSLGLVWAAVYVVMASGAAYYQLR